jgi:hypothetical protein
MKMSKQTPIGGVPTPSVGVALWQIACQWVWNLRLSLGHAMQGSQLRDTLVGAPERSTTRAPGCGKPT